METELENWYTPGPVKVRKMTEKEKREWQKRREKYPWRKVSKEINAYMHEHLAETRAKAIKRNIQSKR